MIPLLHYHRYSSFCATEGEAVPTLSLVHFMVQRILQIYKKKSSFDSKSLSCEPFKSSVMEPLQCLLNLDDMTDKTLWFLRFRRGVFLFMYTD